MASRKAHRRTLRETPPAQAQAGRHPFAEWLCIALIVAAALAAFLPAVRNGFVNWDDKQNIYENPFLNPLTWDGLRALWLKPYYGLYIPLVYTSFAADLAIGGGSPAVFHVHNLLLHAGSAAVVFFIIRRLMRDVAAPREALVLSAAGALVFALHPVQTEAVAWATGRKDLLSGIFSLLAIRFWMEAIPADSPRGRIRPVPYVAATACFLLALLCKPGAVALPVAVLALDYYGLHRPVRRSIPAALPWFAIAGAWTLFTMGVQDITSEVRAVLTPGWMRPFVAGDALLFYARKLLVPEGLVPIYGHTPLLAAASPWFWFGLPAAIAVGFLALRRRNLYSLGFAFAVVFLLPVLGLLPFSYQRNSTVADRYLYCPMLGVGIAVAALLRAMQARGGRWARVSVAVVAVLLAAWAGISFRQSLFWRDSVTLWTRNIAVAPQASVPYTNLGAIYATRERYDETIRLSRLAVECDPLSHLAYANLGMGLLKAGDADGALAALGKSVALRADESLSQGLLGSALRMKGRNNEAQNAFETALRIDPRNLQAALGLAAIHVGGRRHAEAEQILRSAVKLRPDSPIALMNLGVVLVGAGRHADAVAPLREALRLDPANTEAREWLGRAEAGSGGSGSAK